MKLLVCFCAFVFSTACFSQENIFSLDANQSMLMTGKGPGQDGAINPFYGSRCIAMIENMGDSALEARIQTKGKIVQIITIGKGESKEWVLEAEHELYLDTEYKAKVKLDFKAIEE